MLCALGFTSSEGRESFDLLVTLMHNVKNNYGFSIVLLKFEVFSLCPLVPLKVCLGLY